MSKRNRIAINYLVFVLLSIVGSSLLLFIISGIDKSEQERKLTKLKEVNQLAAAEFEESLNVFVAYMSGVRSYLKNSNEFPTQKEFFEFSQFHLKDLDVKDSLIISYLNKDHRFIYSFSRSEINPNNLIGVSVKELRGELEIERLETLMDDEEFHLFPPINLIEGWAGLPLNFNIIRNNESIGYIASILKSESLIESIYDNGISREFIFSFQVGDGVYFDRETVFDSTKIYHQRIDSLSVKNLVVNDSTFVYSNLELYGLSFRIGTAFKDNTNETSNLNLITYSWFIMLFLFSLNALYRTNKYRKLNTSLDMTLQSLNYQHDLLNTKKEELDESNKAKDKIFSIIGHDLKSPLLSIQSIIELLHRKAMTKHDFETMMISLEPLVVNASGLLERLLKWSMINTNKLEKKPQNIKLKDLCSEVIHLLGASADQKNISVILNIDPSKKVFADYNMLSFIVRNIVSNSLKFSEENSQIVISCQTNDTEKLVLNIKDQGIGISQEGIDQLFHVNDNKIKLGTMGEKGSGLGLVMIKEFAIQNSIEIDIDSKVGIGTNFMLIIPLRNEF